MNNCDNCKKTIERNVFCDTACSKTFHNSKRHNASKETKEVIMPQAIEAPQETPVIRKHSCSMVLCKKHGASTRRHEGCCNCF